jgi:hypothetical protein
MFLFIYIAGGYSIFFGYKALAKPGISGAARTLVLKRHATGIVLYIVTSLYVVVFAIFTCYGIKYNQSEATTWQIVLKVLYFS